MLVHPNEHDKPTGEGRERVEQQGKVEKGVTELEYEQESTSDSLVVA